MNAGTGEVYGVVPFPRPGPYERPCGTCGGAGVTGDQYEVAGPAVTLLADLMCPACGGCGNGDPEHRDCPPALHASADDLLDFGLDELDDYDDDQADPCPSCQDRQWNAVMSFPENEAGEPEATEVAYVRVPCGCAEDRVVLVSPLRDCPGCGGPVRFAALSPGLVYTADGKAAHTCRTGSPGGREIHHGQP
jgi:hypothetical protein